MMNMPKKALPLLIIGLLMTTTFPMIGRHFRLPDFLIGFIIGMGIVLELFALVMAVRYKRRLQGKA